MWLLAQEAGVTANPISDAFYDLLPILLGLAGAAAVFLRKRLQEWAEERREEKNAYVQETMDEVIENQEAILVGLEAIVGYIKGQEGPTPEEIVQAYDTLQRAGVLEEEDV